MILKRAGVIPYRWLDDRFHFLLITSRTDGRWIIPKGRIDPDKTSAESAVEEAYEEAGVWGTIRPQCLGTYTYRRGSELHEVEVYEFEVERELEVWPEKDERRRQWFDLEGVRTRIDSPRLTGMIEALAARLNCGTAAEFQANLAVETGSRTQPHPHP